jgi:hypothetical protein
MAPAVFTPFIVAVFFNGLSRIEISGKDFAHAIASSWLRNFCFSNDGNFQNMTNHCVITIAAHHLENMITELRFDHA